MPNKFQMDLILITAVEQYVSSYCLLQTKKKFPESYDVTAYGQEKWHEQCEAYFQTMFDEIMDSLTATIKFPGWTSTKLPLEETTMLRLEATYGK